MPGIEFTDVVKSFAAAEEALGVDESGNVDGLDVATAVELTAHVDDTANPHQVTKEQVGLGNVDNTADADKPISTAQQAAIDKAAWTVRDVVGDLLNGWTATRVRLAYNDRLVVLSLNGLDPASATSDTFLNFSSELRSFTTLRGFLDTATGATNTPTMRGAQIHTGGDVRAPRGGGSAMFGTIWWVTQSAGVPASPPGVPG